MIYRLGVLNEVRFEMTGAEAIRSFYSAAYETIRSARYLSSAKMMPLAFSTNSCSGLGAGNGPYVVIHTAFETVSLHASCALCRGTRLIRFR